ncbi:MAG: hypothetical protein ACN6P1_05590 [Pseudomonas sp.]|uniref:hypothetical protein n=1 Tax=Pseudomonas sp. TaxID=306 RepID=UPI003D11E421
MNYIDYWIYQLDGALAADGDELPVPPEAIARLGLDDGVEYACVLAAALAQPGGAAFEIIRVIGAAGGAYTLERGREGTDAAEWPAGTLVMATVTAAQLAGFGGGGADSGWVVLDAQNGYEYPPSARRMNGVVYLRGLSWVPSGFLGQYLALLPEGWRPAVGLQLFQTNGARTRRITIQGNEGGFSPGQISVAAISGGSDSDYISFDNISFPVG